MEQNQDQTVALMEISIALLHEAYDRLESLCHLLPDSQHRKECSETARYIHAHLQTLNGQISVLRISRN